MEYQSPTITSHFRSQNLVSRGGRETFIETSHPPLSRMSIHRLGFPDHLRVLTPRRAGDALVRSARGETPDEDPPLPHRRPHPKIQHLSNDPGHRVRILQCIFSVLMRPAVAVVVAVMVVVIVVVNSFLLLTSGLPHEEIARRRRGIFYTPHTVPGMIRAYRVPGTFFRTPSAVARVSFALN